MINPYFIKISLRGQWIADITRVPEKIEDGEAYAINLCATLTTLLGGVMPEYTIVKIYQDYNNEYTNI